MTDRKDSAQEPARIPHRTRLDNVASLSVIALCATLIAVTLWPSLISGRRALTTAAGRRAPTTDTGRPTPPPASLPSEPLALDGAAVRGSREAKIAIIEYTDLQCPYCGKFARDTLPALAKEYIDNGRVLFAVWQLPLESIHPFALRAATAVECAGLQGQYWRMHDQLFTRQDRLDDASLLGHAQALSVNMDRFRACLDGRVVDKVRRDAARGRALGVSGTPTFFLGAVLTDGRVRVSDRLAGAQTIEQFRTAIDRVMTALTRSN